MIIIIMSNQNKEPNTKRAIRVDKQLNYVYRNTNLTIKQSIKATKRIRKKLIK